MVAVGWKAVVGAARHVNMPLVRKIILHAPISDEALLDAFVEQCLKDGVSLVAVVGPDCSRC